MLTILEHHNLGESDVFFLGLCLLISGLVGLIDTDICEVICSSVFLGLPFTFILTTFS